MQADPHAQLPRSGGKMRIWLFRVSAVAQPICWPLFNCPLRHLGAAVYLSLRIAFRDKWRHVASGLGRVPMKGRGMALIQITWSGTVN